MQHPIFDWFLREPPEQELDRLAAQQAFPVCVVDHTIVAHGFKAYDLVERQNVHPFVVIDNQNPGHEGLLCVFE
jgi:hypothetical protein